jgi:hypothetical protein
MTARLLLMEDHAITSQVTISNNKQSYFLNIDKMVSLLSFLLVLTALCSPASALLYSQFPICGGSYMRSLRKSNTNNNLRAGSYPKGCGGTFMSNLRAFPEQYVPLAKDMVDPRNTPDTVVYQKITPLLDRYNQQYQAKLEKQKQHQMAKAFHKILILENTTSWDPDQAKPIPAAVPGLDHKINQKDNQNAAVTQ